MRIQQFRAACARVPLIGEDHVFSTFTDINVTFIFTEIPPGDYIINASKPGYR